MAKQVIRHPTSFPLSSYNVLGYRGLIVLPGYIPESLTPGSVDISTPLVKYPIGEVPSLKLNIPVLSSAMQSVSGHRMAIALARLGGLANIYCSQPMDDQAFMVRTVKRHKGAFIEPEVVSPDDGLAYVAERMRATSYSKFFVTEGMEQHGRLLGVITANDFDEIIHAGLLVRDRMLPLQQLDVVYDREIGYDVRAANERAKQSHHSALPVLYDDGRLRDVIFRKDIREHREHRDELLDDKKRLMVAAAINTHDYRQRVPVLDDAGADVLIIDTSQGYNEYVRDTIRYILGEYPRIPVIGGNIVTADGFRYLVEECGVHGVKVGMGIASICITPEQIGIARGQDRAIEEVASARDRYFKETGIYVPIIADGGIRSIKDMFVALSLGADSVMLGRFFAGTDESPTEIAYKFSPPKKPYWGEGSSRAKAWREKRGYNVGFDEGVDAWVDYVGPLEPYIMRAMAQLKDGIRKAGCQNIQDLHANAIVESISEEEVKTHDVLVENQ